MIELPVVNVKNEELRRVTLSEAIFGLPLRADLLARMVGYQLAKRRLGTASTKTRGEIAGGGKKPYRQKGTGNARQGTTRAPHFRTGGIVFGPHPRSYEIRLPKKVRRLALLTALSVKREAGEMILLDSFDLSGIKTKLMQQTLAGLGVAQSVLIVVPEADQNLELSVRNLPNVKVMRSEGVNVYDLLAHEKLVMLESAWKMLEERLA